LLYKFLALFLLLTVGLNASIPKNIEAFNKLPRSIAKDYYMYRFLRETNASSGDAKKLLIEAKRINLKLFHTFAKRLDDEAFTKVSKCLKLKTNKLLKEDNDCIDIGLSIYDAFSLDRKTLKELHDRLKNYKDINETLEVLSSKSIFKAAILKPKLFIKILNHAGAKNRKRYLNKELSKSEIDSLLKFKRFNKSIEIIMTQRELHNLQKSLLQIAPDSNLSAKSLFFLALNATEFDDKKLALEYLENSYKKAYYRFDKDKVNFWRYLLTKKKKYLEELGKSFDVNIYTIYAREKLGSKFENIKVPKVSSKEINYDIKNPFLWTKLLRKLKDKNSTTLTKIANKFKYKNSIAQYSFIKERASGYKTHYFPMPFSDYLKKISIERRSLIFAIARQESRFIPSSISTSYALGMMQFMPFLASAIAKQQKSKNFDLDNMFDPKTAYKFANLHLNYLVKKLQNPLFVAYAYNGGIGYVRRLLKSGNFFQKGKYEPYLSIELISYPQTRKYGKKVVANYIIYMQLLGKKVSLSDIIQKTSKGALK